MADDLLPYCIGCDQRMPPSTFHTSALKHGRHSCKRCECERAKEQRTRQNVCARVSLRVYYIQKRKEKETKLSDTRKTVEDLWRACEGRSVLSNEPAEDVVIIDPSAPITLTNLAPCTVKERRVLGWRVATPLPLAALKKLEALLAVESTQPVTAVD